MVTQTMLKLSEARLPVAVIFNALGDHVMALPTLRALSNIYAGRLSLFCLPGTREAFFADVETLHHVQIPLDLAASNRLAPRKLRRFSKIRYDLLISLNRAPSPLMTHLLGALKPHFSVGLFPGFKYVVESALSQNAFDAAFALTRFIDPSQALCIEDFCADIETDATAQMFASEIRSLLPVKYRILTVHADTKPRKMWPRTSWIHFLSSFLALRPDFFVAIVGTDDLQLKTGPFMNRILSCINLPIGVSIELIQRSDAFVGIDSSMLHIADLAKIPSVGLFLDEAVECFGFRFAKSRTLMARNISALSPLEVLDSLVDLLDEAGQRSLPLAASR